MSERVPHKVSGGVTRTQQSMKDESDINKMSSKLLRSRLQGDPNGRRPFYGYVPSESYHEMCNKVATIENQFAQLPARLRNRFRGQAGLLLAFLGEESNRKEAIKLGLIDAPEKELSNMTPADIDAIREALKPDPESQPKYPGKPPVGDGGAPSVP